MAATIASVCTSGRVLPHGSVTSVDEVSESDADVSESTEQRRRIAPSARRGRRRSTARAERRGRGERAGRLAAAEQNFIALTARLASAQMLQIVGGRKFATPKPATFAQI